jgi:hypothetical protein
MSASGLHANDHDHDNAHHCLLTQARASQLQAATSVVNARNAMAFQDALMPYYTGELDPSAAVLPK